MSPLFRTLSILATGLALFGCAPPKPVLQSPAPEFAKRPYEPFGRAAAVEIALGEWRAFGAPWTTGGDEGEVAKPERSEGLWQRVGLYWWLGMDPERYERAWTGEHDEKGQLFPEARDGNYAWSAAFISYVMRMAGAGSRFPYSPTHSDYINDAARGSAAFAIRAEDPARYAPQLGDLVCFSRDRRTIRFQDLPTATRFPGHCEIVTARRGEVIEAIGGNVEDAVALRRIPVTADGRLAGDDGVSLDTGHSWLAVLRVAYDR